ncbi:MAG: collagenase [Xanthomonadaceae bacterium]|nr:collagenase [Xanthomonadaceae bacterium]
MSFAHKKRKALLAGASAAAVAVLSYAATTGHWFQHPGHAGAAGTTGVSRPGLPSGASASQSSDRMQGAGAPFVPLASRRMPSLENQIFGGHIQTSTLNPTARLPRQPSVAREHTSYDHGHSRTDMLRRPSFRMPNAYRLRTGRAVSAAAACDANAFQSLSGASLVSAVKSADVSCINDLFGLTGSTAYNTFREAQMVTIANALRTSASAYNGTNADSTLQLVLFLRAGYYVQFYDPAVGSYGQPLKSAIGPALDAFYNNANFGLVNDVHGETLAEYVTLIDSSGENARMLPAVKRLLSSYGSGHNAYFWMKSAVNNTFTVMFRGHQNADFRTLVQSDTSIVDSLYNFANANFSRLGTAEDYMVVNAGRETARFLQYTGSVKSLASSRVKALGDRSSITGTSAPLWVGLGDMVDYYDRANCSYYNMCNFKARVEAAALPISHTCSSTLKIRAQSMTASELANTCTVVAGQETFFHDKLVTSNTPVANDNNAALEMVVFNSSTDYGTYAGAIFGIDTNNGGMYLEGNPATVGNQARFIAYEAEWVLPSFEIWNLTHEYVHYLDGRFNLYGDFGASIAKKTVWWIEGLAEYMSYSYRNLAYAAAQQEAAKGTYPISTILQNDYNSGQTRIYNWGYLAVRYMFEKRRPQVTSILGYVRPGNYAGYETFMNGIGTQYDADFKAWLPCVANPNASGCGGTTNTPPTANFTVATSGLVASFTDGSTDPDGSIASRSWNFGDGTTSTATSPSKTYATAGTYTVVLTVTDNRGATATRTQSVTVTSVTPPADNTLANGVARTGLAAQTGQKLAYVMDVPAGATNLKFTMSGGSGDADLYVRFGSAPTTTAYDCRPYLGGNAETCTIANVQAGRYYVMVNAYSSFSGVSLTGSYTASTSLPECGASRADELGKNCSRSNLSATQGNYVYMYVLVPPGTPQLRITSSGGTGNADLYASTVSWATTSSSYVSRNAGNGESIVIANPPSGYMYVSLHAATNFSGVKVSTEY